MFITAKLVFEYYMPMQIKKGMWFKQHIKDVIYGKIYEYDKIFEINHDPHDSSSYIQANGYPVRPRVVSYTANPDQFAETLATYDKIGWWDEGEHVEELRDIELKDINIILSEFDGEIDIDVQSSIITNTDGTEEEIVIPIIYEDKCTLRIPMEELIDDDDDYDDEEDWDDMDDEPEEDGAGYTISDRYNPDDYETE